MGNCMTCLKSPDAAGTGTNDASGHRAHKSDPTVLDTVLGCTTGGVSISTGATMPHHVPERSGKSS